MGAESASDPRVVRYGKVAAALLLAFAVLVPIYSTGGVAGEETRSTYVWGLVKDDTTAVIPLVFAYLWPLLILGLARLQSRRLLSVLVQFVEPVLEVTSCIIVLWIPQLIFETRTLFFVLVVPVESRPEWGCYLAVAVNGLYLVSWLAGLLRPWRVQDGWEGSIRDSGGVWAPRSGVAERGVVGSGVFGVDADGEKPSYRTPARRRPTSRYFDLLS